MRFLHYFSLVVTAPWWQLGAQEGFADGVLVSVSTTMAVIRQTASQRKLLASRLDPQAAICRARRLCPQRGDHLRMAYALLRLYGLLRRLGCCCLLSRPCIRKRISPRVERFPKDPLKPNPNYRAKIPGQGGPRVARRRSRFGQQGTRIHKLAPRFLSYGSKARRV